VLGISTASGVAVGLVRPDHEPIRLCHTQAQAHVESLVPLISQALDQAALRVADLAGIGVGKGPAPYTGLRIGLVTAKTLGLATGCPVWGVSDLDVLAHQALADLRPRHGSTILATLDAKRREVYWALFKVDAGNPVCVAGPAVSVPDQAPRADLVVGEGAQLYPATLTLAPGGPVAVDPATLSALAAGRAAGGQDLDSQPLYLRRPHVQMAKSPKSVLASAPSKAR